MAIYWLVFFSGLAGLIYETLWMKQMGLLFGNTAHAAAVTLAAFFAGLAAGNGFWGRRFTGATNVLRGYAWLEVGIAVTALIYFFILDFYYRVYPAVYAGIGSAPLLLAVKFALALLLIFPPAFCMGGTIPVIGQYLVRNRIAFGSTSALLYGVNTFGAALGALLAGFFLPLWIGFKATCMGAMAITATVAAVSFVLSRRSGKGSGPEEAGFEAGQDRMGRLPDSQGKVARRERLAITGVCFLSGFGFLALEVLWMRMFAQVLENSVYTFAAILVIVLLCLAAGAALSSRLARGSVYPFHTLALLVILSGVAVAITPFIFMALTNSMQIVAFAGPWVQFVLLIFKIGILAIGLPALLLGMVFPFLMKTEERYAVSAGRSLGRLASINTVGAIAGSLACGFLFLETMGMWRTMQLIAGGYLAIALILPLGWGVRGLALRVGGGVFLLLVVALFDPARFPIVSLDPMRADEELLEAWEGSDSTVAVTRGRGGVSIKINSHYGLGATGATPVQRLQASIPLLAFPHTKSIFFLGLGTGITAGTALDPQFSNVTRIVACELVPEVVTASRKYIADCDGTDYTGGLFSDPRASVLVEDGRHYLMATRERFDMINSDLFVPYRSGAGSLYSKEHFQSVKERLNPGGVFVQWLPLYQVTETEFSIITRTMLEVFGQVSLWRNAFQPGDEVVALVGQAAAFPLPACDSDGGTEREEALAGKDYHELSNLLLPLNARTIPFFYCGNVTASKSLFDAYPVNTDDHPLIEYLAPRTYRSRTDTAIPWFVGPRLARLVDELQRRCPPETDPLLANRSREDQRLPVAGAAYHWARLWEVIGNEAECRQAWRRFSGEWLGRDTGQAR